MCALDVFGGLVQNRVFTVHPPKPPYPSTGQSSRNVSAGYRTADVAKGEFARQLPESLAKELREVFALDSSGQTRQRRRHADGD